MAAIQASAPHAPLEPRASDKLTADEPRLGKVLAVIDGTEGTSRAIDYIRGLAVNRPQLEAVLLNIQPSPMEGRLRGYGSFKEKVVHDRLNELGRRAVAAAGRRLDQAGVEHKDRVETGGGAETVLRVASEENCDMILLGEGKPGSLRRWLIRTTGLPLGSLASQVVALSSVPVVVVK